MRWIFSAAVSVLLLTGCTTVWQFAPPRAERPDIQPDIASVEVLDLRAKSEHSDELVTAVKQAVAPVVARSDRASRVVVSILGYHATFETGIPYWFGHTAFQVSLVRSDGTPVKTWDVYGASRKWNWWGYWTAKAAARESFESALSQLLASLQRELEVER